MTAIQWIRQFENYLALVKSRSNNTVRSYVLDAELLYRFVVAGKLGEPRVKMPLPESAFDWATFTEEMAVGYLREVKQTCKDASVSRKIYSLRQFFKFLRKKGVTTADPWGDIETHAIRRPLPKTLSVNEMNRLLTCIRQPLALLGVPHKDVFLIIRDRALLEVLYSAALRVSELCGANWQDIDYNKREITVTGKGNKTRVCPLGQKALEALLEYSRHYERRWEKKPESLAPVFLSNLE